MNLLNDILQWTQTLPDWQSDACRRLLESEEGLSEDDYFQLYSLLKIEHGLSSPDNLIPKPLSPDHLPSSIQAGVTATLKEISGLNYVNRIDPKQRLLFNEKGMTVIYGGNGTGKSGYVRVMKQACRSRDREEIVHANANDLASDNVVPEAIFKIIIHGNEENVRWQRGEVAPDVLSMISVFDSRCARSYLTAEQDVAYLPYGLDIVENLARAVIPELEQRLNSDILSIDTSTTVFDHLLGETEVGRQISELNEKTDREVITKLSTLSESEIDRIPELTQALTESDPIAKADELKRFVSRLKDLAKNINDVALWVSDNAVQKLNTLDNEFIAAETAEKSAAKALRANETLLPGTGEELWKVMFEAARRYSTEIACREHVFPHTNEDAVCPLCQTLLNDETGERLERFEKYIKDDIAKSVTEKRANLTTIRKKIDNAHLVVAIDKSLKDEITLHDATLVQCIDVYQESINKRKQWMLETLVTHKWDEVNQLSNNPSKALRKLAAQQLREARMYIRVFDEESKKLLTQEYNDLLARLSLKKSLKSVLDVIGRKETVAYLEKCKKNLKTAPISKKAKDFASQAVTEELKNALDIEFANLGVDHIKTILRPRNIKGKMHHQLLLKLPKNKPLEEILSEGEQRAIALGSFLAELSLANHNCGIVFDDPVSSLDHWRRQNVARRLVHEAKSRQVIVFTHDTSFLGQLRDEIDTQNLDHKIQYMEWKGEYSGNIREGLPWGHSSYKERIDALKKDRTTLIKKPWSQYPTAEDAEEMMSVYSRLRSTIERVVQDVVFSGVVRRYRDWINIKSLEDVVGFQEDECDKIKRLYDRCNDLVEGHDPASDKNDPVPSPIELEKDIKSLENVIYLIQERRKTMKAINNP